MNKRISSVAGRVVIFLAAMSASPCFGEWVKVDDFQSPKPGSKLKNDTGWTTTPNTSATIEVDPVSPSNTALRVHRAQQEGDHDAVYHCGYLNIEPDRKGTVFLRFLVGEVAQADGTIESANVWLGTSATVLNAGAAFGGVAVKGREAQIAGPNASGGAPLKIKRKRWYRLWMEIDNRPSPSGTGKAFLQEEGAPSSRIEVPGYVLQPRAIGPGTLACVGVLKNRDNPKTDVWLDDLYVDNGGMNSSDPLDGGKVMPESQQQQMLSLAVPLQSVAGNNIAKTDAPIDALNKTDFYQGMWPTDASMPNPKFPCFHVKPVLPTETGVTLTRGFPLDKHLDRWLPTLTLSLEKDGKTSPLYGGGGDAQIAYRTGNLLRLVDTSAPASRSLEMLVVSHRLVLMRVRVAGAATLHAGWEARGTNAGQVGAGQSKRRIVSNLRGWHAMEALPGKTAGETILIMAYEALTLDELDAALEEARKQALDFDELWTRLAKFQSIEPFLIGTETPLERNLVAAMVNRVLRNQRQGGGIIAPSAVDMYGPEWSNADLVWICFQPACRYSLWIEPSFYANSMRTLCRHQAADGRIPQTVGVSGNMSNSQIPNISPCIRDYYEFTRDRDFLLDIYPRFKRWYEWWMKERNPSGDGIIAVGSSKQDQMTSVYEYKDNNPIYHGGFMPLTDGESVDGRPERMYLPDIVACQARMAEDLAFMARQLDHKEDEAYFMAEYGRVRDWANTNLWDEETKFYYPVVRATGKKLMKRSNTAFWLLWAGIPNPRQKDALVQAMFDPKQFYTTIPLPLIAISDSTFNPKVGHWGDGYVWPIDALHVFDGLLRYGEWDKAAQFAEHFNKGVFAAIQETYQPNEFYHHSGKVSGCPLMGTAGCLPLSFQRYLRDHRQGTTQKNWEMFAPPPISQDKDGGRL